MGMRLESEIRDLKERFGIGLPDLTSDELEAFVLACRRVENPFSRVNMELVERPFLVCRGIYGWPMTAGAVVWIEEFARRWWPDGAMLKWAQVYAMVHARDPEAFAGLTDRRKARNAILKTALRLACHRREVQEALLRSYGQDADLAPAPEDPDRQRAQADYASLVARLEVVSGVPAKTWLWERSLFQALRCYEELHAFAAAFAAGDASVRREMQDELDEAVNDLARLKMAILKRHTESAGHEQGP